MCRGVLTLIGADAKPGEILEHSDGGIVLTLVESLQLSAFQGPFLCEFCERSVGEKVISKEVGPGMIERDIIGVFQSESYPG